MGAQRPCPSTITSGSTKMITYQTALCARWWALPVAVASAVFLSASPVVAEAPQTPGIDVSNFQGNIDWDEVSRSGEKFAFVLASDGFSFTSPTFSTQYSGAEDAGLFRGAYHFARPDESDPTMQANRFLDVVDYNNDGRSLPPVVDMENNPNGAQCYELSSAQMISWIQGFLRTVRERTGRDGMIYTSRSFWQACTGNSIAFTTYPLWVAEYGVSQPELFGGWPYYSFWQYTNTGSVPGVNGNVDRDWWNSSVEDLQRLANGQSTDSPSSGLSGRRSGALP